MSDESWRGVPCRVWTGSIHKDGYGRIRTMGKRRGMLAHRAAWEDAHGPIPSGTKVLHKCDNPPCTEVAHLFLGTQADNVADMMSKGRGVSLAGEEHWHARCTEPEVVEIRERYANGESETVLAREFGICTSGIYKITRGITWPDVGGPIRKR